jgi:hypothetical protein
MLGILQVSGGDKNYLMSVTIPIHHPTTNHRKTLSKKKPEEYIKVLFRLPLHYGGLDIYPALSAPPTGNSETLVK